MKITFLGATATVTGSKYMLEHKGNKLLVDCGLFQGLKALRLKNWADFPVDPKQISAILLTHAHLDHSGYIPRLVKLGFRGKVYCTPATKALCEILLPDAGFIQEEEARYANLKGFSKHKPALPLYTEQDAREALKYFSTIKFDNSCSPIPEVTATFFGAGHILGASQIFINWNSSNILFSGDVGRLNDPIMYPPSPVKKEVQNLVVESTYGDRRHIDHDPMEALPDVLNPVFARNGSVIIPAFAVGRTQSILYYLAKLKKQKAIPDIPIFLNSPMAISVTGLYMEMQSYHKLTEKEICETCDVAQYINTEEASRGLNQKKGPMIIIAGSGMVTGGRVLHHIKTFAPKLENLILFTGYQAAGTRGATMMSGGQSVKIHGEYIPINCQVKNLDYLSAHADYHEMIEWLEKGGPHPKRVFIVHGEPTSSDAVRRRLSEKFHWDCVQPNYIEEFDLNNGKKTN